MLKAVKLKMDPYLVATEITIEKIDMSAINEQTQRWIKLKHRAIALGIFIPYRIIEARSTRVDVVSGAAMSSVAIMNAVEDAVQKAR